jgi:hypothetical protein
VTGDAVLALDNGGRGLAWVRLSQLCGHIHLGPGMCTLEPRGRLFGVTICARLGHDYSRRA